MEEEGEQENPREEDIGTLVLWRVNRKNWEGNNCRRHIETKLHWTIRVPSRAVDHQKKKKKAQRNLTLSCCRKCAKEIYQTIYTIYTIAFTLGCLPELDSKTPLLKSTHTLDTRNPLKMVTKPPPLEQMNIKSEGVIRVDKREKQSIILHNFKR